jgi:lysophospholipase L1-like esterase/formamidopyrimidine-DNA glycosylase
MLELPEAVTIAGQIEQTLQGKRIMNVSANRSPHKFAWFYGELQNYHDLLTEKTVEKTASYGGLVEIAAGEAWLLFGDGVNLRYYAPGEKLPAKHQLQVEFEDFSSLIAAVQMYGGLGAFPDGQLDNPYYLIARQKPSPLTEQFDYTYFEALLAGLKLQSLSAKAFLAIGQRIPGLGNGVLQDILWTARIHPKRKMSTWSLHDYRVRGEAAESQTKQWVGTWGTALQLTEPGNMPPDPGLAYHTLRQVVRVSIGGNQVRLKFSNQYGNAPVVMNAVHLAVSAGENAIDSNTDQVVRFGGSESVTIPAGQTVTSDTLTYNLTKLTNMAITIYFGSTPTALTGHPGSRTTSYIQTGNVVAAASMAPAVTTDHWYIITGIDVLTEDTSQAVVALGDSITDGRGTTTNANNRWTDVLASRLQANTATAQVGVLNQGIGGNAVLSGGLGPTALTRFDRDVLGQSGARYLIILEGINDIGGAATDIAPNLLNAYQIFIGKAHARKMLVYGGTILPCGGNGYYNALHERIRQTVNRWIRETSPADGGFDAVIDFDAALRDPDDQTRLLGIYDCGDHLHLNPAGYRKMAEIIALGLFSK